MKYRVGGTGRTVVARFEEGDDVLGGVSDIVRSERIRAGVVYLVGGMRGGKFVVGPADESMPPKPVWRDLGGESHEVIGFGTIFWQGDAPKVHLHAGFGKGDGVRIGCLRENSKTFLVLEAVIVEITGMDDVERALDPNVGLALLKL